jgi:hypothetical protein
MTKRKEQRGGGCRKGIIDIPVTVGLVVRGCDIAERERNKLNSLKKTFNNFEQTL